MDGAEREAVRRWSAAIREIEVLEPWWTESHWDEHYWDDVAELVVADLGPEPTPRQARAALKRALKRNVGPFVRGTIGGLYRDHLNRRVALIAELAIGSTVRGRRHPWRREAIPIGNRPPDWPSHAMGDDGVFATAERRWRPEPAPGSWVAEGVFHAEDDQSRQALCGAYAPYVWGLWPPTHGNICPACVAVLRGA